MFWAVVKRCEPCCIRNSTFLLQTHNISKYYSIYIWSFHFSSDDWKISSDCRWIICMLITQTEAESININNSWYYGRRIFLINETMLENPWYLIWILTCICLRNPDPRLDMTMAIYVSLVAFFFLIPSIFHIKNSNANFLMIGYSTFNRHVLLNQWPNWHFYKHILKHASLKLDIINNGFSAYNA